jgi:hypothetical protein
MTDTDKPDPPNAPKPMPPHELVAYRRYAASLEAHHRRTALESDQRLEGYRLKRPGEIILALLGEIERLGDERDLLAAAAGDPELVVGQAMAQAELNAWIRRDRRARWMVYDLDGDTERPRVKLVYENDEGDQRDVDAGGETYPQALARALALLPVEVR